MFVREQSSKTLTPWRQDVKAAAEIARAGSDTLTGPIVLTADLFMPRPASIPVKRRPYPTVMPDLDKLLRGIGDALRQAGVYKDDAQIVAIRATKQYADDSVERSPGAWITITEVPPGGKLL